MEQWYLELKKNNWQEQHFKENVVLFRNGENGPKMDLKLYFFFAFLKDFVISFSVEKSKLKNYVVIYISSQTPYLSTYGSQVVYHRHVIFPVFLEKFFKSLIVEIRVKMM